jgi:sulfatase maturation enzyme AslB (radical SAM superfamily)
MDPFGNIMPCNGSIEPMIMGNLHEASFEEIWQSLRADEVRAMVKTCPQQCWMIGSASPAMKKRIAVPAKWVLKNKLRMLKNRDKKNCLDPIV